MGMFGIENPLKQFRNLYPRRIYLPTLVLLLHIMRKTILNNMGGNAFMVFCILLNIWAIYRLGHVKRATSTTKLFLYYGLLAAFSCFWAVKPEYGGILAKDAELMSSYVLIACLLWQIKDFSKCYLYVIIIASMSSLSGLIKAFMTGWFHTNSYSISAMIGFILALNIRQQYNVKQMNFYLYANALALYLGTSIASYVSAMAAFVILRMATKRGIKVSQVIVVSAITLIAYALFHELVEGFLYAGRSQANIESNSGRDVIWETFLGAWHESPLVGWGYSIAERSFETFGGKGEYLSAHNGYLSMLVNTGILGLALGGWVLFKAAKKCFMYASSRKNISVLCTGLFAALIGGMINNYAYPLYISDWNHTFPPFIALLILILTAKYKDTSMGIKAAFRKNK